VKICAYMMKKDKIGVWCVSGMSFFPGTRKRSVHVDFIKKRQEKKKDDMWHMHNTRGADHMILMHI
jgi:hypothetical protein